MRAVSNLLRLSRTNKGCLEDTAVRCSGLALVPAWYDIWYEGGAHHVQLVVNVHQPSPLSSDRQTWERRRLRQGPPRKKMHHPPCRWSAGKQNLLAGAGFLGTACGTCSLTVRKVHVAASRSSNTCAQTARCACFSADAAACLVNLSF